ncbi:hypothetical protein K439DRAFT_1514002 [Ramaria rubella]|nr:hypothetical protein K439DRAFT_1514002 [Ramaria rubella]
MPLSIEQLGVLQQARQLLEEANILLCSDVTTSKLDPPLLQLQNTLDSYIQNNTPHPNVLLSQYVSPPATYFTAEQILQGQNRITRQSYASAIVEHPIGAIVEFPQTVLLGRSRADPVVKLKLLCILVLRGTAPIAFLLLFRDRMTSLETCKKRPAGHQSQCIILRFVDRGHFKFLV